MQDLSISKVNAFCRKFDLVFVEMGREKKQDVLCFIDFRNARCTFTPNEIIERLDFPQATPKITSA